MTSWRKVMYRVLCQVGLHEWVYLDPQFPRVVTRDRVHYPKKCRNCMREVVG